MQHGEDAILMTAIDTSLVEDALEMLNELGESLMASSDTTLEDIVGTVGASISLLDDFVDEAKKHVGKTS